MADTDDPPFDATEFVRAAAPAVGLKLDDASTEAVAMQLMRAVHFARIVHQAAPDLDRDAPAPVFDAERYTIEGPDR